jgi:superfamily II DNA or RNA helicase
VSGVQLTDKLLAQAGGWQAMKEARALHAAGRVLSAEWHPPRLTGEVQGGAGVLKTGLLIKDAINVENLCPCKESRQWGKICAHALALGIEVLNPSVAGNRREAAQESSSELRTPNFEPTPKEITPPLKFSPDGELLQLAVILPPNLAQALATGSISVFFEGLSGNRRLPLAALDRAVTYSMTDDQLPLFHRVIVWANGELPATLKLSCEQLTELLALLPEDSATFGRKESVVISDEPFALKVQAKLLDSGDVRLAAELPRHRSADLRSGAAENFGTGPGRRPALPDPVIIPGTTTWVLQGTTFSRLQLPGGSLALLQGPQTLPRAQVPGFLQNEFPVLAATGLLDADFTPDDFEIIVEPPVIRLELVGGLAKLRAKLSVAYDDARFALPEAGRSRREEALTASVLGNESLLTSARTSWLPDPNHPRRYRLRDFTGERDACSRLVRAGFEGPDKEGRLQLTGQDAVLTFFARDYPRLQSEWQVTLEERLDWSLNKNVERIAPRCEVRPARSGEQWFDFGVQFETPGGEKFSNADIQSLVRGGRSHTKLRNGKFALLDTGAVEELSEILIDAAPKQEAGGYRVRAEQAAYLNETVGGKLGWPVAAPTAWKERVGGAAGELKLDIGPFTDVLRPYQKDGVRWLHKLRANGFGGILADEMGLGKTLQALAHLSLTRSAECGVRNEKPGAPVAVPHSPIRIPHLVVCPTSLVFNWQAEAAKFAPHLRVLVFTGPDRHAHVSRFTDYDLLITSYALIRRDADAYRPLEFDTVILDEAQHIKNRQSQNAQAVKSIRCRHRLVLTGTPMENSVLDLWSIFDFLLPGYLGSATDFRERYELPLSRGRDPVLQDRLSRRVRPFLLRRLKRDVAPELPAKLEQISFCELTADQRAVYQQVLDAGRSEVLAAVGKEGFAKSRMVIFTSLLRLRQICCDLRLLALDAAKIKEPSGKLELFGELLEEIIDGGHRALVFSQFTTMLDLLGERLAAGSIDYCRLDGSTKDRGAVVRAFQTGRAPVFLISLKAGGVGLNLTAADTVVHFDPWWNPAVEDQATDRAHRIGQRRVVTSYKLITRDTVEEKILKLQQKKRDAIQAVFGDETALTEALTWDEVQELFD